MNHLRWERELSRAEGGSFGGAEGHTEGHPELRLSTWIRDMAWRPGLADCIPAEKYETEKEETKKKETETGHTPKTTREVVGIYTVTTSRTEGETEHG